MQNLFLINKPALKPLKLAQSKNILLQNIAKTLSISGLKSFKRFQNSRLNSNNHSNLIEDHLATREFVEKVTGFG